MAGDVAIAKRPAHKATSVDVKRSGGSITASWKVPASATKSTNNSRWEWLVYFWKVICDGGKFEMVYDTTVGSDDLTSTTSSTMSWSRFKGAAQMGGTWSGVALSRSAFWPLTSTKISSVVFNPMACNWKGAGDGTRTVRNVSVPRKPIVGAEYDETAGEATFTVEPGDHSDFCERYDTRWRVTAKRSDEQKSRVIKDWAAFTGSSASYTYDLDGLSADFAGGTVATLTVEAYSRGLAGDGATASSTVTVAYPRVPTIKSVSVTTLGSTGRVTVAVKPGGYTSELKLQRVVGLAANASPNSNTSWSDVSGAVDDQQCSALYDLVSDAKPSTNGTYTWYRLVATNCGWTSYSAPFRADALYTPADTAANDRVGVVGATTTADGSGALVVIGFNEDSANTGTEIQWTDLSTWYATDEPSSYKFTWKDDATAHAARGLTNWSGSTFVNVRSLSTGTEYMIRARRYLEGDGDAVTYTPWSNTLKLKIAVKPASVTLSAPTFVRRGRDIEVSWQYDGDAEQTSWAIHPTSAPKTSWASGTGTLSYASIRASRYGSSSAVSFYVSVATGGETTNSNTVTVSIADVPRLALASVSQCTAKPASFTAYCDNPNAALLATVASMGVSRELPDGDAEQMDGEVVWTGKVKPAWSAVSGQAYAYGATVEIPHSADLVDKGRYSVTVAATDDSTGLTSAPHFRYFDVAWSHQAPAPSDSVSIVADTAARSVTITMSAPTGYATGDVYDVWRKSQPGYDLVASDLPLTATVTDAYAPFGESVELAYRVALRTADGDVEWADLPYELPVSVLRIDFDGDFIELPYDISLADSWAKSFESRAHVDGSVNGYWDAGVARTGSFATRLARVDADQTAALRRLAEHSGACMVRTPDGRAFQANVDVSVNQGFGSEAVEATLNVAAVRLTDYMAERT